MSIQVCIQVTSSKEDEDYFTTIKNADFSTHYINSNAELKTRSKIGQLIYRFFGFILPRSWTQPNLHTAYTVLKERMREYSNKTSQKKDTERSDLLLEVAKKFNDVIHKINEKKSKKVPFDQLLLIRSQFLRTLPIYCSGTTPGAPLGASVFMGTTTSGNF